MSASTRGDGFTLLEVLVAVAIAGLALVALFRAGGDGLLAVDTSTRMEEAVQRAQSHLAAVGRDIALLQGDTDGDDGGGYRWRLRIAPAAMRQTQFDSGAPAVDTTLYDVEVSISWPGTGGQARSVMLKTQRIGTAAASR